MTKERSRIVVMLSDVHFPHHDQSAWEAVMEFIVEVQPYWVVLDGDLVDLAGLGVYEKKGDEPTALEELMVAIREINRLAAVCERVTFVVGNHENRWKRILGGVAPHILEGLEGLTLRDQFRAQGLSQRVEWFEESVSQPALRVGQFHIRHGHKQAGRFGGGVNIASTRLNKSLGVSEAVGHHHAAQHVARAGHGRVAQVIANPCLTQMHEYAGSDMVWLRGFTIFELFPSGKWAQPHLIVLSPRRRFAWAGRVYGQGKTRREDPKTHSASKPAASKPARARESEGAAPKARR